MNRPQSPLTLPTPELRQGQRFEPGPFTFEAHVFAPEEQAALHELYDRLEALYQAWLAAPDRQALEVRDRFDRTLVDTVQRTASALRSRPPGEGPVLQELVHDLRGGGLSALVGIVDLMEAGIFAGDAAKEDHLQLAIWFARDHAKMMRMALPWLDPERADTDRREAPHEVGDLVRKWNGARYPVGDGSVHLRVHCRLPGALASRCVEAAALDRVCYNLLNNAARFAADGEVHVHLDPVGEELGRIAVENAVTSDQASWLGEHLVSGGLFRSGVTRGGNGDGLASVARLVSAVFGTSPAEAVASGIVGLRLQAGRVAAWFHWPRVTA